jgi:membrane-associated phospholipid phosphatase
VCGIAVTLSFLYLDVPIALRFSGNLGKFHTLGAGLGSAVLLSAEAATTLTLVLVRLVRGHLSPLGKLLVLACLTSMCAYAVNDSVLKLFFGVASPSAFLAEGAHHHAVHFLAGDRTSGFPSGHMVLAGSFAGVVVRLHPSSTWPLSILVLFGAGLLILGDWHFASDVIAGTFAGVSVGVLSGSLWLAHSN